MATVNVRFDNPADQENAWGYRKKHFLEMMSYYSWDVAGLQEVCGNQLEDISRLSEYSYEGIGRENDNVSEHVPVLYKKDRFEKEDGGTFWLSLTPDYSSKSWNSDCKRICTWVRLKDIRNGKVFVFLNTHLDHVSEEARFKSVQLLKDWIEEHASNVPVVLAGDFNAFPEERCYQVITGILQNARQAANAAHYGPTGTFTGFDYSIAWEDLKEIDYIFASRHVNVLKTRTVVDSFDGRYPSDHFPVTAVVEF
ncbi:endonuclease/exonuclease/phosphatase family protein [Paenibacillus albidus]|uniref:endonuclease/exonuclease/phosphatase family protein n=1 Tax=Paenibacillus albidus TaxID=2041023 RepID=UPI00166433CB|nr:endonuclease/exonuclease/phosphatase family protein [Paenibacillus albidus]